MDCCTRDAASSGRVTSVRSVPERENEADEGVAADCEFGSTSLAVGDDTLDVSLSLMIVRFGSGCSTNTEGLEATAIESETAKA